MSKYDCTDKAEAIWWSVFAEVFDYRLDHTPSLSAIYADITRILKGNK